jgi:alpha/beta superfamily hydrolase
MAIAATWPLLAACADDPSPKPPPAVVATADAISREVQIESPGGAPSAASVRLNGHVFGSGATGIVLAHMRPADQSAWYPFAASLAATGRFTVLTFDFRGFGASPGEKAFDRLDTDLAAALGYMRATLGVDKAFLVGASMGGTASLVVGAREVVAGVVSISSPAQFETLDALSAEPSIAVPQLFVTSQDDVPARRSLDQLVKAAGRPVEQQVYDGNAHGTDLFVGPHAAEVESRIVDFLSSN